MTDEERQELHRMPVLADWLKVLGAFAVIAILATTAIIVATSVKLGEQTDLIAEQRRNHDASVCVLSAFHALSAASGKPADEARDQFNTIFQESWLVEHCALTPDEARRVIEDQ